MREKILLRFIIFLVVLLSASFFFFTKTRVIDTANLTSASVLLSNSRASFRAGIGTTALPGASIIYISNTNVGRTNPDLNTNNLGVGDTACFWRGANSAGCAEQIKINDNLGAGSTIFNLAAPIGQGYTSNAAHVLINQRTNLTVNITLGSTIPSNGDIFITIPAADVNVGTGGTAHTFDGLADTGNSTSTNGFDIGGGGTLLASGDINVGSNDTTSCSAGGWSTITVTAGGDTTDHTIRIQRNAACSSGVGVSIGFVNTRLVNPAPTTVGIGQTQGAADIYMVNVKTRDGSQQTIDTVDINVAPVEGILVSATVDETLAFTIAGIGTGGTACGVSAESVATTATSVPWGTLSTANSFYNAAHQLTVSTNADAGYAVRVEENDQMGRDGQLCSGTPTEGASTNCIIDALGDNGTITNVVAGTWATATNHGFAYSLQNASGSDAAFTYLGASNWAAKRFADQENSEAKQTIMSNSNPISGSSAYVCYRLAISATQAAGYYFNKLKYTATATF